MAEYHHYIYCGAVMEHDRCVDWNWCAETYATSAKKAKSNLTYQWKRDNNRAIGTKITLVGEPMLEED